MSTLRADLEYLTQLGGKLHELAGKVDGPFGEFDTRLAQPGGRLSSVQEASDINDQIIDRMLCPALRERLSEVGDVMISIANEYRDKDDSAAEAVATALKNAAGVWTSEETSA